MTVRSFCLVPDRALQQLEQSLAPVIAEWSRKWLGVAEIARLTGVLRAELCDERPTGEHWGWQWPNDGHCIIRLDGETRRRWIAAMLNRKSPLVVDTPLTTELWMESADALVWSILGAMAGVDRRQYDCLAVQMHSVPHTWTRPGSGIITLELDGEIGPVSVMFEGGSAVRSLLEANDSGRQTTLDKRLVPLQHALVGQPLSAHLVLASEEMALGDLLSLQPGDVIVLGQRSEQPVNMRVMNSRVRLNGHLGERRGRKAFVVDSATVGSETEESPRILSLTH